MRKKLILWLKLRHPEFAGRQGEEVALGKAPPPPPSPPPPAPSEKREEAAAASDTKHGSLLCCSSSFMFRSKRNALVKRLWKSRIRAVSCSAGDQRRRPSKERHSHNNNGTTGEKDAERMVVAAASECGSEMELKSVAHSLLKRLKETQLSLLVEAVESGGGTATNCVLIPKGDVRIGRRTVLPNVLCCQLWRWNDVRQPFELKRLAWCTTSPEDPAYVCSNPYHWSRLAQPESPPPYTRCAPEWITPEDCLTEELDPVSVATGGSNQLASSYTPQGVDGGGGVLKNYWCSLAYWEMRTRVGRLFPVHKNYVNVFSEQAHGDGLCLSTLAKQNQTNNEAVRRTREKIGYGLSVSNETDGVWAYNRTEHAIFVNSPTLQPAPCASSAFRPSFTVYKVPPGHSIKVFDFDKSLIYQKLERDSRATSTNVGGGGKECGGTDGPYDHNAVRISFAKGWGPKYSRQVITSCPCWLEILLVPPR